MKNATVYAALNLIHRSMLIGQSVFTAVMFYLVYSKTFLPVLSAEQKTLQVIALVFTAVAIFTGINIFKKKLELLRTDISITTREKLIKYRSAMILRWALTEVPVLICGICLLFSGNYAFLALAIVVIIYFAMLAPAKRRIAAQLGLSGDELDEEL